MRGEWPQGDALFNARRASVTLCAYVEASARMARRRTRFRFSRVLRSDSDLESYLQQARKFARQHGGVLSPQKRGVGQPGRTTIRIEVPSYSTVDGPSKRKSFPATAEGLSMARAYIKTLPAPRVVVHTCVNRNMTSSKWAGISEGRNDPAYNVCVHDGREQVILRVRFARGDRASKAEARRIAVRLREDYVTARQQRRRFDIVRWVRALAARRAEIARTRPARPLAQRAADAPCAHGRWPEGSRVTVSPANAVAGKTLIGCCETTRRTPSYFKVTIHDGRGRFSALIRSDGGSRRKGAALAKDFRIAYERARLAALPLDLVQWLTRIDAHNARATQTREKGPGAARA